MTPYTEVLLPYGDHIIYQDAASQGVSLAAEILHRAVIQEGKNAPLRALELGCGCGIISIMCALIRPYWLFTAIEIQAHLAELARRNAERCALEIDIHCADFRKTQGSYELIFANPPWRKLNSGILSPNQARNISRFELSCDMDSLLEAIQRLLSPGGKAIVIYPQSRLKELQMKTGNTLLDIKKHHSHSGTKACFVAIITHRDTI